MSVTQVILPKLGLTMDEGRLVGWLKREGDEVEAGEILFEVETDKATMEVEAPVAGYVRRLLASAGDEIPVTQVIALITTTADEPLDIEVGAPGGGPEPAAPGQPAGPGGSSERIIASPAARKRAQELGVDLAGVTASKGGRISVEDVEAAAGAGRSAVGDGSAAGAASTAAGAGGSARGGIAATGGAPQPLSRMRRTIAERMTHSFRDVPQFSVSRDVDMTAAQRVRTAAGVSYADVLVRAVALTLRDHPRLAMRYDTNALVPADGIHVGIAVALEDGLLVPVLRDADLRDLPGISRERAALQDAARAGKLTPETLSGAVFTISNLGQHGVDRFTALVNPPEAAILAVGRVRDQVVARDGVPTVLPVLTLTLSVDHRVADGAQAAAFLADLAGRLEAGRLESAAE